MFSLKASTVVKDFFPSCEACRIVHSREIFCESCLLKLRFSGACKFCGQGGLSKDLEEVCLPCLSMGSAKQRMSISFFYEGGVRTWLKDIKQNGRPERFRELLLKHLPPQILSAQNYDWILGAASDPIQTKRRLFDPSDSLCRRLSTLTGVPFLKGVFDRHPFLHSQKELDRESRKRILRQTLVWKGSNLLKPHHRVLFVDDIVTTAATVESHLKLLKNKVSTVDVYALARTLKT